MKFIFLLFIAILSTTSCNNNSPDDESLDPEMEMPDETGQEAEVVSISVSGDPNAYSFSVEVKSPDTGCDQYADWWEVVGMEGSLKYRRILLHSHVQEQPFTRSGGPVRIGADERVYVRAHMNNMGYGSKVFAGSVDSGFAQANLEVTFADSLASQPPLPDDCDF